MIYGVKMEVYYLVDYSRLPDSDAISDVVN